MEVGRDGVGRFKSVVLHPNQPYIAINNLPKIESLKRLFPQLLPYRADPVLVAAN